MKNICVTKRLLLLVSMIFSTLMIFTSCSNKQQGRTSEKSIPDSLITDSHLMVTMVEDVYVNNPLDSCAYDSVTLTTKVNGLYFSVKNEFVLLENKMKKHDISSLEQLQIFTTFTDLVTLSSDFVDYYLPSERTGELEHLLSKYTPSPATALPEKYHKKNVYTREDVIKELKAFSNLGRCLSQELYDNTCDTLKSSAVNKDYVKAHYTQEMEAYYKMQRMIMACTMKASDLDARKLWIGFRFKRAVRSIRAFAKYLPKESATYDAQTNRNIRFFRDQIRFLNNKEFTIID